MASKPGSPRKGSVESLVKWHVAHGTNIIDLINKVTSRFPNIKDVGRISEYTTYWSKELGRTIPLTRTKRLTDRQRAQLIQYGYVAGYKRVTVDVTWISEKQGDIVTDGWAIDIPDNLTNKQEQEAVYNVLAARFAEQYQGVIKTMSDVAKVILGVQIRKEE